MTNPETPTQSIPQTEDQLTFHPDHITPQTFHALLSLYPKTVEKAYSNKIRTKQSKTKTKASSKRKADTDTDTDTGPNLENYISEETNRYIQLDKWRYETLPRILAERAEESVSKGEGKSLHLLKEELIGLMEWKLKHGINRPMLKGMIKSNPETTIKKSTTAASALLPSASNLKSSSDSIASEFPKSSLEALTTPLRGVGPATASLILSVLSIASRSQEKQNQNQNHVEEVPFYSDDVYLWVCLLDYPGMPERKGEKVKYKKDSGELIARYDVKEYRELWEKTRELRERVNLVSEDGDGGEGGEGGGGISLIDVERVAYVLRNIGVSGYYDRVPGVVSGAVDGPDVVKNEVDERILAEKSEVGEGRRSKRVRK
ncbi:hypothetical protein N7461_000944 [Penicillium sp. DV-2018c]|nr:hypothetical protein N7461_000944 [Penicillium sp. DV-2018c]